MDTKIRLPEDFKIFLRLLSKASVEYLLVGGYAVGFHGYPRPTGDIDIWISNRVENAEKVVDVLKEFGFGSPELNSSLFTEKKSIVRMGVPPFKLELITYIDGVTFDECYQHRVEDTIDDIEVKVISLQDLLANKKSSGRPKDINDLLELSKTSSDRE